MDAGFSAGHLITMPGSTSLFSASTVWRVLLRQCFWLTLAACGVTALAQPASVGRITGRVFNPATGDYVRNAEVRLAGTAQVVATESDGSFAFEGVAPGAATITVSHTGYQPVTQTLTVAR